jgi:hypothetical protein
MQWLLTLILAGLLAILLGLSLVYIIGVSVHGAKSSY